MILFCLSDAIQYVLGSNLFGEHLLHCVLASACLTRHQNTIGLWYQIDKSLIPNSKALEEIS
jgi:hypothetical protein